MTSHTPHVQAPRTRPAPPRGHRAKSPRNLLAGASRRQIYLAAIAGAAVLAAVLIGVSALTSGSSAKATGPLVGTVATSQLLAGIPQHGTTLGSPHAPYTLIEYADFQCPYCGIWGREVFPSVVKNFVRTGKVQVVFRGLDFVGPDSRTALETALAAAAQNKFWNVEDLLYRNQGTENTGWVSDSFVRGILAAVPGLDASRVLSERGGAAVATSLANSGRLAGLAGVSVTPTFAVASAGGSAQPLTISSLDVNSFSKALRAAIGG